MSANLTPPAGPAGPVPPLPPLESLAAPREAGPRAGTVIWGLLFVTIGVVTLIKVSGREVDFELLAIAGLAVAGVALLLTAVIGSRRSRRRP